jgi:hypothetical protein
MNRTARVACGCAVALLFAAAGCDTLSDLMKPSEVRRVPTEPAPPSTPPRGEATATLPKVETTQRTTLAVKDPRVGTFESLPPKTPVTVAQDRPLHTVASAKNPATPPTTRQAGQPEEGRFTSQMIPWQQLADSTLDVITSRGHVSRVDVRMSAQGLTVSSVATWELDERPTGVVTLKPFERMVGDGKSCDIDTGQVGGRTNTSDLTYRRGQGLVPENGAVFRVAIDFHNLRWNDVASAPKQNTGWLLSRGERTIFFQTSERCFAKATFRCRSQAYDLEIVRFLTWSADGKHRKREGRNIKLKPGDTFDFDSGLANTVEDADISLHLEKPKYGDRKEAILRPERGTITALYDMYNF